MTTQLPHLRTLALIKEHLINRIYLNLGVECVFIFVFKIRKTSLAQRVLNELVGQETRATETGLYIFKMSHGGAPG